MGGCVEVGLVWEMMVEWVECEVIVELGVRMKGED